MFKIHLKFNYRCVQFCSVAQSCLTLCDPMDCSTPGLPVHHQLLEVAQIHIHQFGDAIQPFNSLSSPSPPAFKLSHHQGLFQWVSSSHQVAKIVDTPNIEHNWKTKILMHFQIHLHYLLKRFCPGSSLKLIGKFPGLFCVSIFYFCKMEKRIFLAVQSCAP